LHNVSTVQNNCPGKAEDDPLVALARRNLAAQVPLLVHEVLQLQAQPVDLAARVGDDLARAAHREHGAPVQAAQRRDVREQLRLLPLLLGRRRRRGRRVAVGGRGGGAGGEGVVVVEEGEAGFADGSDGGEDLEEVGVVDWGAGGHFWFENCFATRTLFLR
jgi:hypothetical protein